MNDIGRWSRESGKAGLSCHRSGSARTADYCEELKAQGLSPLIPAKTGLVIDALLQRNQAALDPDHVPGARAEAEAGKHLFWYSR